MSDNNYIDVKCIKEIPNRPFFCLGSKYSSKQFKTNISIGIWVGIPGHGGHNFNNDDFDKFFETIK